jgi:tRNA (Thr-GGU) A37 N-methylase
MSEQTSAMTDADEVRPGEIAVTLPQDFDAGLYFIGRIHTPWTRRRDCPKNPREAGEAESTIEIDPRWAEGLRGVETCTHIIVLSLRSPARPNPIALSVARLLRIEGTKLTVTGLDCLDGTACLDIKPYFASIDSKPNAEVGWHKARQQG